MVRCHDVRHMRGHSGHARLWTMNTSHSRQAILRELALVAALAVAMFIPGTLRAVAQTSAAAPQRSDVRTLQMPDLVAALKSTPGVLGVDAARTVSGKQVVFAWFENKQAVLNWYYSPTHQGVMRMFSPGGSGARTPLAGIADDSGPILTIASLTMMDAAKADGVTLPVSQIAIELYAPLPGGLAAGGRFAPSTVRVPGLVDVPMAGPPRP